MPNNDTSMPSKDNDGRTASLTASAWLQAGTAWKHGKHQVWINGKPRVLYVPRETIIPTFEAMKAKLKADGIKLGIDHLDEAVLAANPILRKTQPLDVGTVEKIGTDGESIYILESKITNPVIKDLESRGELPAHSIIGPLNVDECERKDIDYVLKNVDVDRIDYVERGGCQECLVNSGPPGELLLTSKSSKEEFNMVEDTKEDVKTKENPTEDPNLDKEELEGAQETEVKETPEDESEIQALTAKVDKLEGMVQSLLEHQGEVPAEVKATLAELSEDRARNQVRGYIRAGLAVPAQEETLMELVKADPGGMDKLMKAGKPVVDYDIKGFYGETETPDLDESDMTDEELDAALKAVGIDPEE